MYDEAVRQGALEQIIKAADDEKDRPIHIACEFGNAEVVQWILSKKEELKVNVNEISGEHGLSPLFLSCLKGFVGAEGVGSRTIGVKAKRLEIAKLLVENGAEVNFTETIGYTALHWAAYNDDPEMCRYLLNKGAN